MRAHVRSWAFDIEADADSIIRLNTHRDYVGSELFMRVWAKSAWVFV